MLNLEDILKAQKTLEGKIKRTPVVECPTLEQLSGYQTFLKLENLQKTGSFKLRGALNKISHLSEDEKARGVIASSAGNHAQGVALSASHQGIKATIVMPATTPLSKIGATRGYGADVVLEGSVYDDAFAKACALQKETGAVFIHPFDDEYVMAGQGTIGLEILEDVPDVDIVLVPIGGGGMIAGIAKAIKSLKPNVKIIGVESANAPSMQAALAKHESVDIDITPTIADGIAVRKVGEHTCKVASECVDEVISVSEEEIARAILFLLEKSKIVAEGAGAVTTAALLAGKIKAEGKKLCLVVSGGNIDINLVERVLNKALINEGRRFAFHVRLADKAGEMARVVTAISKTGANILSLDQTMYDSHLGITFQQAHFVLECFDEDHKEEVRKRIEEVTHSKVIS